MIVRTCTRIALAAGWLAAAALPVAAQDNSGAFRAPQQIVNQPGVQTQAAPATQFPNYNFSANPYMYPPGGYGYGFGGYYPGRAGGYLNGVAALTTANANSFGTVQQARVTTQQANQAQLDTRRRMIDEYHYEQSRKPTTEDMRAQEQANALRRARNDPPRIEIWDGTAFNSLLANIQRMQASGLRGPFVPLDPNLVRHINLTGGAYSGNVGLLKDGGKLDWPFVLKGPDYAPERQKLDELCPQAVREAMSGQVRDETINAMTQVVDNLRNKIDGQVQTLPANTYIKCSRYCNELRSTVLGLQSPEVAKKLNGQWSAQGNNVAQLIDDMTNKGLKFAPVTPGDETSYTAMYQSLISYDMGLNQLARGPAPAGQ
jgi:hypothetical protein